MRIIRRIAASGFAGMFAALFAMAAYGQTGPDVKPICANCHEAQSRAITFTAHGAKNDAQGSMCQACHGDASAHLKDPVKAKPAMSFAKGGDYEPKAAPCLACHSGDRNLAFWTSGKHAMNEVACSNCHSIHGRNAPPTINRFVTTFLPNQADLCGTCHQQVRTATQKPSHHPIPEGKVKCSDCHNPHGALTHAMIKQPTINDQCYSCHADKRGPYVFNHPPVEENCATCHQPHGSSHRALLVEHVPNLCQDCHDWSRHPGTVYGAAGAWNCSQAATQDPTNTACYNKQPGVFNTAANTRLLARGCLNCHSSIHGSNAPANRGKFFIR